MLRTTSRSAALALGLVATLAACEVGTGPDGSETRVLLRQEAAASQALLAQAVLDGGAGIAAAVVRTDRIASIDLSIAAVQALPAQRDALAEGGWVSLPVTAPTTIDLLGLPVGEGGIVLARGDLPAGTYEHMRLVVAEGTITFREPVTVGQQTYPAGVPVALTVPSGRILVPLQSFTVGEDAGSEILLAFDADASVRNIVATGSGWVQLPPVIVRR